MNRDEKVQEIAGWPENRC